MQEECLGEGSLAWIWGDVVEDGCPALLIGEDKPIFTFINCEAHLPVICQYPVRDYSEEEEDDD